MSEPKTASVTNSACPARRLNTRAMAMCAMLAAVAFVLMFLDFSVPLIPAFVKMDFSELPALLASFALGPVYGVVVCLVKNLLHLFITSTNGAGELCNFLLGASFCLPAGLIYKFRKNRRGAVLGSLAGAVILAVVSVPINYFISYPAYVVFYSLPLPAIIGMYQAIRPSTNGLLECLLIFNMPFNLVKGLLTALVCFLIYKPLSPILHGRK